MKKNIKAIVIRPDNYSELKEKLPVVYLLHGYGCNYADWITKAKGFEKATDLYQMMIVCPDGGIASWYWHSPVDPHDFTSRTDIHNWTYWENAIGYQLLFMNNYFKN